MIVPTEYALYVDAASIAVVLIFGFLYIRETFKFMEEMDNAAADELPLMIRLLTWLFLCGMVALALGAAGIFRDGIMLGAIGFMVGIVAGHAPFMLGALSEAEDTTEDDDVLELRPEWIDNS